MFSSSPWNRNHDQQGFAFNVASARKAIPQEQIAIKLFKEKIKKKQIKSKKAKEKRQKRRPNWIGAKTLFWPELPRGDRTLNINVANICTSTTKLPIMF